MNDSGEIIVNIGYVVSCKIALVVGPTVEPSIVSFVAKLCPSQVHRDLRDADSLARWGHARVDRVFLDLGLQCLVEMRVFENMDGTLEPRSDRWSGSSNPFRIAESATRQCWLIFTNFSSIDILNKNLKKTSKTIVWFIFFWIYLEQENKIYEWMAHVNTQWRSRSGLGCNTFGTADENVEDQAAVNQELPAFRRLGK